MNLRPARLSVLLVVVVALMGTITPPASATTFKLISFSGVLITSKGLGYPCTPNKEVCPPGVTATSKAGPKNEPEVNITTTGGLHATYLMASALCLKSSSSTPDKATQKNGLDLCLMTSFGVIWGWCGLAEMVGIVTIENLLSDKETINMLVKGAVIAGKFYIRGGDKATNIYMAGNVTANVDPGGGSCSSKTGHVFTVTGSAVYKNVTFTV